MDRLRSIGLDDEKSFPQQILPMENDEEKEEPTQRYATEKFINKNVTPVDRLRSIELDDEKTFPKKILPITHVY